MMRYVTFRVSIIKEREKEIFCNLHVPDAELIINKDDKLKIFFQEYLEKKENILGNSTYEHIGNRQFVEKKDK